jgi:hypothetical protein
MFLRMKGPYKLNMETILEKVTRKSPGNYVLGRKNLDGEFRIGHIGRSDSDIAAQLKSCVGMSNQLFFKFSYAKSSEVAFKRDCKIYHARGLTNHSHPTRPKSTTWQCPRCDIFGVRTVGGKKKDIKNPVAKPLHGR